MEIFVIAIYNPISWTKSVFNIPTLRAVKEVHQGRFSELSVQWLLRLAEIKDTYIC